MWATTTCAPRTARDLRQTVVDYAAEAATHGAVYIEGIFGASELRWLHAAHYSGLMREAAPRLLTSDQLSWLTVLRADRDNILAALRYWCDADEAGNALSLVVSLSIMAMLLGNDSDMAEWIGEALAVPGEADAGLRTMAEALHVVTSAMDPAAAADVRAGLARDDSLARGSEAAQRAAGRPCEPAADLDPERGRDTDPRRVHAYRCSCLGVTIC